MAKINKVKDIVPLSPEDAYKMAGEKDIVPVTNTEAESMTNSEFMAPVSTVVSETLTDAKKAFKNVPFGWGSEIRAMDKTISDTAVNAASSVLERLHLKAKSEGKEQDFFEIYRKNKADIDREIAEGYTRSPVASFMTNLAGDAAAMWTGGQVVGAMGAVGRVAQGAKNLIAPTNSIREGIALGGIAGLGESQAELTGPNADSSTAIADTLQGSGFGGAFSAGGKALNVILNPNPDVIRSRFMGANKTDFTKTVKEMLGDPVAAAKKLKEIGFFKHLDDPNYIFSVKDKKIKKSNASNKTIFERKLKNKGMDKRTLAKERINEIINKAGNQADEILQRLSFEDFGDEAKQFFTLDDILKDTDITKNLKSYINDVTGGLKDNQRTVDKINEIAERFVAYFEEPRSLKDLQKFKREVMSDISEIYKKTNKETEDLIEANTKRLIVTEIKNFINNKADELIPYLKEVKNTKNPISKNQFSINESTPFMKSSFAEVGDVRKLNDIMHNAFSLKEPLENAVAAGMEATRSTSVSPMFGQAAYIAQKAGDTFAGGQAGMLARAKSADMIRNRVFNFVMNKRIPRTTNNLFDYRNVVYARLVQNNPTLADIFYRNVINQDKNTALAFIKNNSAMLSKVGDQVGLFEDSPYQEFDGKPTKEGGMLYINDINNDELMNVFEKAKEINRFNKTGKIYQQKEDNTKSMMLDNIMNNQVMG